MTATKLWYPHHIEKYRRKTGHLTIAEHGAYRLLMDAYWDRRKPLPTDETRMRKLIGADTEEWEAVREAVLEFFTLTDDGWRHDTIEENISEAERQYEAKRKRMANARAARGLKDKNPEGVIDNSNDKPLDKTPKPLNVVTPSPSPSEVSKDTPLSADKSARKKAPSNSSIFSTKFWEKYPRRKLESGQLSRGNKQRAYNLWMKLNADEKTDAILGIDAFRKAHPDKSGFVVDAERYLKDRRWLDAQDEEAADEPMTIDFDMPEGGPELAFANAFISDKGKSPFATWFCFEGKPMGSMNGAGMVFNLPVPSSIRRKKIEVDHGAWLDDYFGRGNWRVEG